MRRALRPSFVVTIALGATVMAGGCSKDSGTCPAEEPAAGAACDVPSSVSCTYGPCADAPNLTAVCQQGTWTLNFPNGCNPPPPVMDAGRVEYDAGPDVDDGGADGEGQDGGHVADATGDVAPDADSE